VTARLPYDPDAITRPEVARLLGVGEATVARYRREGLLVEERGGRRLYSRTEVESFLDNPWLSGRGAARILGVSHNRVSQLANDDKIPVHHTRSGRRVYRKLQVEVVARARATSRAPRAGT
jgi:DNA-binding transcriptional MerR regulator